MNKFVPLPQYAYLPETWAVEYVAVIVCERVLRTRGEAGLEISTIVSSSVEERSDATNAYLPETTTLYGVAPELSATLPTTEGLLTFVTSTIFNPAVPP